MVDGLHGEPIRQIKLMNENSTGQSIDEIVSILRTKEDENRRLRKDNFCRVYGETPCSDDQNKFEIKDVGKYNIQMIRMVRYDRPSDKIQFKEIACFCQQCLNGKFNECLLYKQPVISADIVLSSEKRQLRTEKEVVFEDDEKLNEEILKEPILLESNLDMNYINKSEIHEFDPIIIEHVPNLDVSVGSVGCSSPNQEFRTSSQKVNSEPGGSPDKKASFGDNQADASTTHSRYRDDSNPGQNSTSNFDPSNSPIVHDSAADEDYISQRLNFMGNDDYLSPRKIGMNVEQLRSIFNKKGLLFGDCLNFVGNMLMSANPNDCVILKTEFYRWFKAAPKWRFAWKTNLLCSEAEFKNAKERYLEYSFKCLLVSQ